ncbi:MAG: response regulator [Candidatus Diapherotrites archaeon]|nr:response regulator [Candidatus Diapherotrites archaeon]
MSKILVVDDEIDTIGLVKRILKNAGHEVEFVLSGKDCLKKVKTSEFDLILLDIMMPEVNGWDVLLGIRKMDIKQPRIVFLSVKSTEEYRTQSEHRPKYSSHIGKPFSRKELLDSVEDALSRTSSESKKTKLNSLLNDLSKSREIVNSVIVSVDGFPIASDLKDANETQVLSAEVAAVMGAADSAIYGLKKGGAEEVLIKGNKLKLVTIGVSKDAYLAVLSTPESNDEEILKRVESFGRRINKVLKE